MPGGSDSSSRGSLPLALCALGGMALFLREGMLDRAVLPLARIELMPGTSTRVRGEGGQVRGGGERSTYVPVCHGVGGRVGDGRGDIVGTRIPRLLYTCRLPLRRAVLLLLLARPMLPRSRPPPLMSPFVCCSTCRFPLRRAVLLLLPARPMLLHCRSPPPHTSPTACCSTARPWRTWKCSRMRKV